MKWRQMPSKDFQEFTEGFLNVAKLLGLIIAGCWTIYQWELTIFPRESFEDFKRRAALRVDISSSVGVEASVDELHRETDDEFVTIGTRLSVSGALTLRNTKDFPVSVEVHGGKLALYDLPNHEDKPAQPSSLHWQMIQPSLNQQFELANESYLGPVSLPIVVEPGAVAKIPILILADAPVLEDEATQLLEFTADLKVTAIFAPTGRAAEGAVKSKIVGFRGFLESSGVTGLDDLWAHSNITPPGIMG